MPFKPVSSATDEPYEPAPPHQGVMVLDGTGTLLRHDSAMPKSLAERLAQRIAVILPAARNLSTAFGAGDVRTLHLTLDDGSVIAIPDAEGAILAVFSANAAERPADSC